MDTALGTVMKTSGIPGFFIIGLLVGLGPWEAQARGQAPAATPSAPSQADPVAPAKRDDYIKGPGAPRPALKNFRDTKPLSASEPAGKKLEDLQEALKGKGDANLLDAFAKVQVARLTRKGNEADRELLNTLSRAAESRSDYDETAVRSYKSAVYKYLAGLLDNSLVVQVNALHVASEIQNGFGDVPDGIALFLKVLKDPAREDAVKLMALVGLINAKEKNLVRADEEQQASAAILAELQKADLQSVLEAKLYETLGVLGRCYAQRPGDVQVASVLARGAMNPSKPMETRIEAGRALAKMTLSDVPDWNSKLQAQIVATVLRDWLANDPGFEGKGVDDKKYEAYLWAKALQKSAEQPPNRANNEYASFVSNVAIGKTLVPLLQGTAVEPDELAAWIEKNPVGENRKLAPRGPEIAWPVAAETSTTAAGQ